MKKIILLLTLLLTSLALVACKTDTKPENKPGDKPQDQPSDQGSEIRYFLTQGGQNFNPTSPVFKLAQDYAGIKNMTGVLQKSSTNAKTVFTTNISSTDKDKIMHLVSYDQVSIEAAGIDGKLADLTNLIEEHAPNLKKFFADNADQKKWATAVDGKIYGIPFYTAGVTAKGFFLRTDYVDKMKELNLIDQSLDVNELTVVQLTDLMTKMKANITQITGNSNITPEKFFPYFDRDVNWNIYETVSLWNAFGGLHAKGKTVSYGPLEENYKTAMEEIAKWKQNGIIGDDFFVRQTGDYRNAALQNQTHAVTHDWIASSTGFNTDKTRTTMQQPNLKFEAALPFKRADGTRFEPTSRKLIGLVTGINASASKEDQIKLIKWIDFFFTPEGTEALNFGIKDTTFTKIGGKYKYTDKILDGKKTALANLLPYGAQMNQPGVQDFAYEEAWATEEALNVINKYINANVIDPEYNTLIFPKLKLNAKDAKEAQTIESALKEILVKKHTDWLKTGQAAAGISQTDWDNFKKELQDKGADRLVEIYQSYVK